METRAQIEIETAHGLMPSYTAVPTTAPPWAGVVVIHDFTGIPGAVDEDLDELGRADVDEGHSP